MPTEVQIYKDGTIITEDIANSAVTSAKLEENSNGKGKRIVSTNPTPSGGSDGDIWYVV